MLGAIVVGAVAGVVAGMLGVGGGALFVPALVLFLGLSQIDAEATSLLAIVPVALVGAWRQHGYGNVDVAKGLLVGVPAIGGAVAGALVEQRADVRRVSGLFAALLVAGPLDLLL